MHLSLLYRLFLRGDLFVCPVQSLVTEPLELLYALSFPLSRGIIGRLSF
jgi:hypothetical protein